MAYIYVPGILKLVLTSLVFLGYAKAINNSITKKMLNVRHWFFLQQLLRLVENIIKYRFERLFGNF